MGRASRTAMTLTTSFRNLEVWQESMMLVEEIYALSRAFPRDELFSLTAQLHKTAIPSNIGEGARRKKLRVTLNHYDIALGSQGEVEVQLEIAKRLGYCTDSDYGRLQERVERVGRMLNGLIASIQPDGPWTWCLATLGLL
jgi:four helix bundle protein